MPRINAKKKVLRICEFCGKQFMIDAVRVGTSQPAKFCSPKCRGYAWRAKQLEYTFEEARIRWIDRLKPLVLVRHDEKIFE